MCLHCDWYTCHGASAALWPYPRPFPLAWNGVFPTQDYYSCHSWQLLLPVLPPHSCSSPTALPTSPSLLLLLSPLLLLHPNSCSFPIQTDSIQLLVVVYSSIDYWWVSSGVCLLVATCWLTYCCAIVTSVLQTALMTELMTATEAVPSHSHWHYIKLNKLHMGNLKHNTHSICTCIQCTIDIPNTLYHTLHHLGVHSHSTQ